jgi:type IV pilus assembly protein PilF
MSAHGRSEALVPERGAPGRARGEYLGAKHEGTPPSRARLGAAAAVLVAGLVVAGCTTTTTTTRGSSTVTETHDRVTASDESDTARRARVRMELASAYFGRGQIEVALDQVKLAIAADPNLADAYNLRGLIYAGLGDDQLAEESFRRGLQINPRDADAMHNLGWFYCQRRRYPQAFAMFDQALAVPQYREVARTLLAKGVCLAFDKQYAEAERTLARALQLDPTNPATATNLAEVQYRLGDYASAQATIRRVNANAGVANAQTLWLAARIERALGNTRAVAELGARLTSQFADSPEAEAFSRGRFGD